MNIDTLIRNANHGLKSEEGVDCNPIEAVARYRKAAQQGCAEAQCNLGEMYAKGEGVDINPIEAIVWYRKAAEQGFAEAQCNLGVIYEKGAVVDRNLVEAVGWYRKAAEQGFAKAQCNLGVMYENGIGVDPNPVEAVTWYRKAAEQGFARAQFYLGIMYANGDGVDINFVEAVAWYRKAAEQGFAEAQCNLGVIYEKGAVVDRNLVEAVGWYRKAAEQGFVVAQYNLGLIYAKDAGVDGNLVEAVAWYRKAAEQGFAKAQYNLGKMYANGTGVDLNPDPVKAVFWFSKAAEQGLDRAQYALAVNYETGEGIEKDIVQAINYYRLSAEQQFEEARNRLQDCKSTHPEALYHDEMLNRNFSNVAHVLVKNVNILPLLIAFELKQSGALDRLDGVVDALNNLKEYPAAVCEALIGMISFELCLYIVDPATQQIENRESRLISYFKGIRLIHGDEEKIFSLLTSLIDLWYYNTNSTMVDVHALNALYEPCIAHIMNELNRFPIKVQNNFCNAAIIVLRARYPDSYQPITSQIIQQDKMMRLLTASTGEDPLSFDEIVKVFKIQVLDCAQRAENREINQNASKGNYSQPQSLTNVSGVHTSLFAQKLKHDANCVEADREYSLNSEIN